jgi:uncharacterized protein (DUF58 family)
VHLARRSYLLLVLTAILAVAGLWSTGPALAGLWRWPAALLLAGAALESLCIRRAALAIDVAIAARAFLGRPLRAAFTFRNDGARPLTVEYAPVAPIGFEGPRAIRMLEARPAGIVADEVALLPVRLGAQSWPAIPARILGRLGLIWWSRNEPVSRHVTIAPDTVRVRRTPPQGAAAGTRARRAAGAGSELHQLRDYVRGDPLARIDWKATSRARRLVSRELSEDQHLDVLLAIDAGRSSRVRAGRLDRLGLYANIAARFAQVATPSDDRVGLVVYSDRPLVVVAPQRGLAAVMRVRRALEGLAAQPAESEPLAAVIRIRPLLKHRSLVVLLTDLEDASAAESLAQAVRMLSPPHLTLVAGVHSPELGALARATEGGWRDPWVALAASERESRAVSLRALLRRLGAPVVAAREELLESAVLAEYESLRRAHRI